MSYSIEQIARLSQLSKSSIRYYEKKNILKISRAVNGYRVFSEYDLIILRYIALMKKSGFSLREISSVLEIVSVDSYEQSTKSISDFLSKKLDCLMADISSMNKTIKIIQYIKARLNNITSQKDELDILGSISDLMSD